MKTLWVGLTVVGTSALLALGVACSGEEFVTGPGGSGTGATGLGGGSGGTNFGGGGSGGSCADADLDGVTDCAGDCDDTTPAVSPNAPEICGDGIDNDCDLSADPSATCLDIGTYVSALAGDDNNPGTQAEPVLTIAVGIAKAVQLGKTQPVFVAEGSYAEDVTLTEGVSLLGGYSCASLGSCTWQRDPAAYAAIIENQDGDGVYAGHQITRATMVEGFTINALGGNPGSAQYSALFLQGSPVIRANLVNGAAVTGCGWPCGSRAITVTGPQNDPSGALIERNIVNGGDSTTDSFAILVDNAALATIDRNEVNGGTAAWTRGIGVSASAGLTVITRNAISAGPCLGDSTTFGIYVAQGQSPIIDANWINTDPAKVGSCLGFTGNWWTGGIESEGSTAVITNNVVLGVPSPRSTAVLLADCEGACQIGQAIVNSNTLAGGGALSNNSLSAAIVFKTWKAGQNVVVGRVRNNVLVGGSGFTSFGGYEDVGVAGSSSRPQFFQNNDLFDATALYYLWNGATASSLATLAAVNTTVNGASGNVDFDPALDATGHLTSGSPCIDAGTLTGGETPATDIDGDPRPAGALPDIGADEAG
ncbi:MAG: putative metal-binding motif-containing protein [Polyangiaceae bacterium]|nr:putative metal-binding motif-containing protein [Polyangiaceae bacterium]